ncbi:MAG: PilZ domain-containing protein [Myxococcota bacterium]
MARILIVDDDPDIRRLLRTYIEAEGHEVLEADDVREAIPLLDRFPDAAFLGISMPGETGAELLLKLRKHPQVGQIPAIFITAHAEFAMPIQNTGLTGPYVIHKPFRREQIADTLRGLLRSHRRRINARIRLTRDAILVGVSDHKLEIVKNLSFGGVFVVTEQRWPVGDNVQLTIRYRDQAIKTNARVTHTHLDGVGFAFVRTSAKLLSSISNMIGDLLTERLAVDDRRQSTRIDVSAAIVFSRDDTPESAQLRDISDTGALVLTRKPPPVGSRTYVYLPGYAYSNGSTQRSELRGCLAEVVRSDQDTFACEFRDPSAEFSMAVKALIEGDEKRE